MNPPRTCQTCGSPLLEGQSSICSRCYAQDLARTTDSETLRSTDTSLETAHFHPAQILGDYEILGEIARGGMGIVYKARQKSLNRTVALKITRGGKLATPSELKRFQAEAEAAANLQHPNIVAVHGFGEHEGRRYLSMDFVDGSNLAEFTGAKPLSPAQAAHLLKTLASAVAYAHERGTLHRDLKPENILIDRAGHPRITDFGLAKRLEKDSSLTSTGQIIGSPGYMPPEQASGAISRIGPASDVYALGAVLYFMLTGRAPFTGESPLVIIRKVLDSEPVPPSKLNDRIPADLQTICLKCLEKKPERRYRTAGELLEELDRFLNHEQIVARPATTLRKAYLATRKHPWAITGLLTLVLFGLLGFVLNLTEQVRFMHWQRTHAGQRPNFTLESYFSESFLYFLLVEALFLQMVPFAAFLRFRAQRSPPRVTSFFIILAIIQLVFASVVFVRGVVAGVWVAPAFQTLLWPIHLAALTNFWFAAILLWQCLRDLRSRQAEFAVPPSGETQLLRVQNRKTFLLLIALQALVLTILAKWVHAFLFASVYVAASFGITFACFFAWAVYCSRGFEATVYIPAALSCVAIAYPVFKEPWRWGGYESIFIGLVFGFALIRFGRFERAAQSRQRSLAQRLWARERTAWILLAKRSAYLLAVIAIFLCEEHLRGRLALASWKKEMAATGEKLDLRQLWPVPNQSDLEFSNRFARVTAQLPERPIAPSSLLLRRETRPGYAVPTVDNPDLPLSSAASESTNKVHFWTDLKDQFDPAAAAFEELALLVRSPAPSLGVHVEQVLSGSPFVLSFPPFARTVQTLPAAILNDLHSRNSQGALEKSITLVSIAGLFPDSVDLTTKMLGFATLRVASDTLWTSLQSANWTESQLKALQEACEKIDILAGLARVFEVDRLWRLELFEEFRRMSYLAWYARWKEYSAFADQPDPFPQRIFRHCISHPIWCLAWAQQEQLHYLSETQIDLDCFRAMLVQPSLTELERRLQAHHENYVRPIAGWRYYLSPPFLEYGFISSASQSPSESVPAARYALPIIGEWRIAPGPNQTKSAYPYQGFIAMRIICRNITSFNLAVAAIAVKRYQLENQQLPPSLDALRPKYLTKIPLDLMDGQPLRYRLNPDQTFTLYSIGLDAIDNGGDPTPGPDKSPRDLLWPKRDR